MWGDPGSGCKAFGSHSFVARAGHHLAPLPLSSGRNIFEELGEGFSLLGLDADEGRPSAFEVVVAWLGMPLKIVKDTREGGRDQYQATLVLVRPDQFVAWAASDSAVDGAELLRWAAGAD